LAVTIDTVAPTVAITSDAASLKIGQTANVTFTFSEPVTGLSNAEITAPHGTLSGVTSSDGGLHWSATFTPDDGATSASNVFTLADGGVSDIAGNTMSGATSSDNFSIDTLRPTASIALAHTALTTGETSLVTVTFSEPVTGFTTADLTPGHGTLSGLSSSDGGVTWTATLTPDAGVTATGNVISLDDTGVRDLAGNAGTGTTASADYEVNTVVSPPPPPPPTGLTIVEAPGGDSITGDAQANVITPLGGADTVSAGGGSDSVGGGSSNDVLQGNTGNDSIAAGAGADVVYGGQDNDTLQGNTGGDVLFGDKGNDIVLGGQGADTVQGGEGNDYVSGDLGDDVVRGGQGDDRVFGGPGADFLSGDRGSDTLTGGPGADTFHSFGGAGIDLVTDFNLAEGDHILLDPGTTYTLSQVGADVHIDMVGGGELILAGVQLTSLTGNWITA
jgi:Ca2+-binding RTX toxin-like protein